LATCKLHINKHFRTLCTIQLDIIRAFVIFLGRFCQCLGHKKSFFVVWGISTTFLTIVHPITCLQTLLLKNWWNFWSTVGVRANCLQLILLSCFSLDHCFNTCSIGLIHYRTREYQGAIPSYQPKRWGKYSKVVWLGFKCPPQDVTKFVLQILFINGFQALRSSLFVADLTSFMK